MKFISKLKIHLENVNEIPLGWPTVARYQCLPKRFLCRSLSKGQLFKGIILQIAHKKLYEAAFSAKIIFEVTIKHLSY